MTKSVTIRSLDETDLGDILVIDEKISGQYRPAAWEGRMAYYLRRDPEGCLAADLGGKLAGFMIGEVRSGEFGIEEPTGWIEVLGVDPEARGQAIGRRLAERMLEHFRAQGATHVRTLVDERMDRIAAFFESLGFEPAPLRPYVKKL
jgi:ribosomal protein S18 acetylase RimI-like enzyme